MEIKVFIDCGVGSNSEEVDTVIDLCLEEGQWEKLNESGKYEIVRDYWENCGYPEVYWEEE